MCFWKREWTYLFLPFVTTLVRQPHYTGGRCADKLEEYTAVLGNRASFIVLTDSVGNEPEDETAKFYVLKKVKNMRLIKNVDSNFATHVFISRDILLDYLFKNSKQSIHYRHKTNNISLKIINIVYCKTRWEITPVFVCDI